MKKAKEITTQYNEKEVDLSSIIRMILDDLLEKVNNQI